MSKIFDLTFASDEEIASRVIHKVRSKLDQQERSSQKNQGDFDEFGHNERTQLTGVPDSNDNGPPRSDDRDSLDPGFIAEPVKATPDGFHPATVLIAAALIIAIATLVIATKY